jgi:rubrerythrin
MRGFGGITMADLIERQAAIDAMERAKERYFDRKVIIGKMQDIVNNLPSAQKKGKWIYLDGLDAFECSFCGRQMVRNIFDFCPWCGARMEANDGS